MHHLLPVISIKIFQQFTGKLYANFRPTSEKAKKKMKSSILSIKKIPSGMTKTDLASYYGLKNFDTAIPQPLFDLLENEDFDPWGNYVYDYTFYRHGTLFPLTTEAIARYELVFKSKFIDPRQENENKIEIESEIESNSESVCTNG